MKTLFLVAQGGLMGLVVGEIYQFDDWEFWFIVIFNAILVVTYGSVED